MTISWYQKSGSCSRGWVFFACARTMCAAVTLCAFVGVVASAQSNYQLRPEDTINVTVENQPDLSQQYVVDEAGQLRFPLIGQLQVAGLTASGLASELHQGLAEFFTDPHVSVDVERTKRVFVFGGVAAPGMYQLTDNMTLIELLARAGYGGASEAVIIRATDSVTPALPDHDADLDADDSVDSSNVIRVNLRELERDLRERKIVSERPSSKKGTQFSSRGSTPTASMSPGRCRTPVRSLCRKGRRSYRRSRWRVGRPRMRRSVVSRF